MGWQPRSTRRWCCSVCSRVIEARIHPDHEHPLARICVAEVCRQPVLMRMIDDLNPQAR